MSTRPLAVSLVALDGHPTEAALDAIAACGATHAEPAYISGTMDFTEDDLSEAMGAALARRIAGAGLGCLAVSAHMDCGAEAAGPRLAHRIRFAAALGAQWIITKSTSADRRGGLAVTLDHALPVAAACGVRIAFENPGNGAGDLLARGRNARALMAALASPWIAFNYDPGNVLTNSEAALRPEAEFDAVLPDCAHLHVEDMAKADERWDYCAIGDGAVDWRTMLARVPPALPVCLELPLRLTRPIGQPPRRGQLVDLGTVSKTLARSVAFVRESLGGQSFGR